MNKIKINLFIKRLFDITASSFGIIVLFIPFLIIALLIKISSKGPVFFKQIRIGKNGKQFYVIKFRTMYQVSEALGSITTYKDARITPIGKFLRKYKLDELPQLWNVLIGKMSFVGPRPDVPGYADKLEGEAKRILDFTPGITGPASLYFRNEEQILAAQENPQKYNDEVIWPKKIEINLNYINNWNFFKDIGYILITVFPFLDKIFHLVPENDYFKKISC